MGAKRAVPGRSAPYDILLAAFQKNNQAKQQSKRYPFLPRYIGLAYITKAATDVILLLEDKEEANAGPVVSNVALQGQAASTGGLNDLLGNSANIDLSHNSSLSQVATAMSPIESSRTRSLNPQRSQKDKLKGRKRVETMDSAYGKESLVKITPSASTSDAEKTFSLSEEFTFMFRECHSSDVLQLLRDYWHHYSQWIDGAHMKWQDTGFLDSCTQLRNDLRSCLVESAKGPLPLQETVLPMIDPQLDHGRLIPALDIQDPQHPEWTLLNYFGVIIKGDIHYYLRCLIAISEEPRPDVENVAYIYEEIQARYKENEELIRYVSHGLSGF